jgi:hypothetical protein
MRLPFLNRTSVAAEPAPIMREIGFPGLQFTGGLPREEYLSKLTGAQGLAVYDRMLRSDEQVGAVYQFVSLPLRAARVRVDPGGDGATDGEAAELIESNLAGMSMPFDRVLQNAAMAVMLGCAIGEKVWEERDGYVMLRKLAPRHPRTVDKWLLDDTGGLAGIVQAGYSPDGSWRSDIEIPIGNLVVFTPEDPFGNPEGLALCRRMYRAWWLKDTFLKIGAVGMEKTWQRIPLAVEPPNTTKDSRDTMLDVLKRIRTGEDVAITVPFGWKLEDFMGPSATGDDLLLELIRWCDQAMARAALGEFIMLGQTGTGSRAVGETQAELFVMAENALAAFVAESLNRYWVRQQCLYNWPDLKVFPRIAFQDIGVQLRLPILGDALNKLGLSTGLTPDADVENTIREWFGFPPIDPDARADADRDADGETDPSEAPNDVGDPGTGAGPRRAAELAAPNRPPAPFESGLPLDRLRERIDAGETALGEDLRGWWTSALEQLVRQLAAPIRAAVGGNAAARGRLTNVLSGLSVRNPERYAALLERHLARAVEAGLAASADVLKTKPDRRVLDDLKRVLRSDAQGLAEKHVADVLFGIREQAKRDVDGGLPAEQVVWNVENAARRRAALSMSESLAESSDRLAARIAAELRAT